MTATGLPPSLSLLSRPPLQVEPVTRNKLLCLPVQVWMLLGINEQMCIPLQESGP